MVSHSDQLNNDINKKKKFFTDKESWSGGYFELYLYFPKSDIQKINKVIKIISELPNFEGFYDCREKEPWEQEKIKPNIIDPEGGRYYSVFTLPNHKKVPCQVSTYHTQNNYSLLLIISHGSLNKFGNYPLGPYPFYDGRNHKKWIEELTPLYFNIAKKIFENIQFSLGFTGLITGYEIDEISKINKDNLPKERYNGYLINEDGKLLIFPPNIFKSQFQ